MTTLFVNHLPANNIVVLWAKAPKPHFQGMATYRNRRPMYNNPIVTEYQKMDAPLVLKVDDDNHVVLPNWFNVSDTDSK